MVAGRHVAASDTLLCPAIEVPATSAPALLTSVTISCTSQALGLRLDALGPPAGPGDEGWSRMVRQAPRGVDLGATRTCSSPSCIDRRVLTPLTRDGSISMIM